MSCTVREPTKFSKQIETDKFLIIIFVQLAPFNHSDCIIERRIYYIKVITEKISLISYTARLTRKSMYLGLKMMDANFHTLDELGVVSQIFSNVLFNLGYVRYINRLPIESPKA